MQAKNFDQLLKEYRQAIDAWVAAIRAEEALANDDHSMVEMEKWDTAWFYRTMMPKPLPRKLATSTKMHCARKTTDSKRLTSATYKTLTNPHRIPYEKVLS